MSAPRFHNTCRRGNTLRKLTTSGALVAALVAAGLGTDAYAGSKNPAAKVEATVAKGNLVKGIAEGEAAAAANPHDGAVRTALGRAYLKAGRFESAASALGDAVALGETSSRAVLSLALAEIATGHERSAVARLDAARDGIPASDLGLAMALAGETGRGVAILSDALRGGDKSVKIRENLAYAYALDGRWGEARMMVALDLPADKVDARLTQWAQSAQPDATRERIATLLGVPVRVDAGMPAALALNAEQAPVQLAVNDVPHAAVVASAPAPAMAAEPAGELAPLAPVAVAEATPAPHPVPAMAPAPAAVPVQAMASMPELAPVSAPAKSPVLAAVEPKTPVFDSVKPANRARRVTMIKYDDKTPAPAAVAAVDAKPVAAPVAASAGGDHVVQLGAFLTPANAERAKRLFKSRDHGLIGHNIAITKAEVNGRTFWRVAAVGYDATAASTVCGTLKRHGGACFAYAADAFPTGQALAMASPRQVKLALNPKH